MSLSLHVTHSIHILMHVRKNIKQVAQRATIAHLSPMCQGQILFKKSGDTDVLDAQGQLTL